MATSQNRPVPAWKTVVTVLCLLFFFPLGVLFMFLWMKWPLWVKLVLSVGLVVLALVIIPILAAIAVVIINPLELTRRARDAVRFSDTANIEEMIVAAKKQATQPNWLCGGQTPTCEGKSTDPGSNLLDGTGWVKINFTQLGINSPGSLPIDPVNSPAYYYRYCSDGKNFEIDTKLESKQYANRAQADGLYKVGTDLTLCK